MILSKAEALFLTNVLFHHELSIISSAESELLRGRLKSFLLEEDFVDDKDEKEEELDEEELEEDEDEDDEDSDDLSFVESDVLHELSPLSVRDSDGEKYCIEFDVVNDEHVDLLVGERGFIKEISKVQRTGKALTISSADHSWKTFCVSKFPADWIKALRPGELYTVDMSAPDVEEE